MDKGLIMSLTGEQEHLIAADFWLQFHLRVAQPLLTDPETGGQGIDMGRASENLVKFVHHCIMSPVALEKLSKV